MELQNEVLKLRAQTGDADTVSVIKRELSEQVAHIKKLEVANREQAAELKQYRKHRKNVEVVEEEKRALEQKVKLMGDLRRELGEAQLQQQMLEDEKRSWAAYLESDAFQGEALEIKSPEDMARAFLKERLEKTGLMEKLGVLQPELSVKDDNIRALEEDKARLTTELQKARASSANTTGSASDVKIRARLERQRALASKEVEYLRAQLKTFDTEENEFQPEKYDEAKAQRISELEGLIDEHRSEIQTLHQDLTNLEQAATATAAVQGSNLPTNTISTGAKRTHDANSGPGSEPEDQNHRVGETLRRNRKLQDDLSAAQTRISVLTAEMDALRKQLSALQSSSRTRILELRSNPTNDAAAIKQATLTVLRNENEALRAQLARTNNTNNNNTNNDPSSSSSTSLVPAATVATLQHDLAEQHRLAALQAKRTDRLKKQWTALAADFRDVAASLLGWRLEFLDGKRVRVSSVFCPGETPDENSIVFDSKQGTMKVSGGRESVFAGEIRGLLDEWVDGKRVIPCFLAAVTLEFWGRAAAAEREERGERDKEGVEG